jgi:hypothetical protein
MGPDALRRGNSTLALIHAAQAAVIYAAVALPPFRARYDRYPAQGVNPFRWLEYSLSASLMVVLIAMLTGIADYVALLALFGVNAAMIFLGWLMELLPLRRTVVPVVEPDREGAPGVADLRERACSLIGLRARRRW